MKLSVVIAALAVVLGSTVAVPQARADLKEILDKGTIRIGTQMDNPPFGYLDAAGKPTGFDIELGQMIGKALGVKVEVEQIIGANRIPYLLTNKIDLVISGMGATPERAVRRDGRWKDYRRYRPDRAASLPARRGLAVSWHCNQSRLSAWR